MELHDFNEINLNKYDDFKRCLDQRYNNSESSFATMYMWQHYFNVKYYIENDIIFSIYKDKKGNYNSFMPYGKNRNSNNTIDTLLNLYNKLNSPLTINLCTDDFVDFLSSSHYDVSISENRNSFDYVYYTDELINLKGKRFHSKKNHINSFVNKYEYQYLSYLPSMKDECLNFCDNILKQHYYGDENSYKTELYSIVKTFDLLDIANLRCGIIKIDNKIIALTVGERLNDDYALIHIEKADYNYRTAYSLINNLFLKNEFSDTLYVNREEDMGIEGLRKAKKSYHPCNMIKKYTVKFNV